MKTLQRSSPSKKSILLLCVALFLFIPILFLVTHMLVGDASPTPESTVLAQNAPAPEKKSDLVIFSYDRPLQLYALLESIAKYVQGIASTTVIYRASEEQFAAAYDEVHTFFPSITFLKQGAHPQADFKPLTLQAAFESPSAYILFAVDDIVVKDAIDITQCIELLEKTNAYAFYLRLGKNLSYCYSCNDAQAVPPMIAVTKDVYAWHFLQGSYDWSYPHTVDMTIYRKKDIQQDFVRLGYHTPNQLEAVWAGLFRHVAHKCGLCFATTKIVNLPLNCVQHDFNNRHMNALTPQELLQHWQQGHKMDIEPLHEIINKSAHMDYEPTFIERKGASGDEKAGTTA